MKTSDLIGPALDWAVAKCEGYDAAIDGYGCIVNLDSVIDRFEPSTNWCWGGPIIEREKIELIPLEFSKNFERWASSHRLSGKYDDEGKFIYKSDCKQYGLTPLIASMRCHVASKLGDEVDIPEELE